MTEENNAADQAAKSVATQNPKAILMIESVELKEHITTKDVIQLQNDASTAGKFLSEQQGGKNG